MARKPEVIPVAEPTQPSARHPAPPVSAPQCEFDLPRVISSVKACCDVDGATVIENPGGRVLGGHGLMVREVDPVVRMVRVLNWWGEEFGDGGSVWLGEEWFQRPWCGEAISFRAYYHRGERPNTVTR